MFHEVLHTRNCFIRWNENNSIGTKRFFYDDANFVSRASLVRETKEEIEGKEGIYLNRDWEKREKRKRSAKSSTTTTTISRTMWGEEGGFPWKEEKLLSEGRE